MDDFSVPDVPGYTVGRELGRGASSSVWLVTEARSGRDFALKCLLNESPRDDRSGVAAIHEAVRREIRILSVLDHPHLIKAHDVVRLSPERLHPAAPDHPAARDNPAASDTPADPGTDGPGPGLGLLMEYAPGGSLGQLVRSRGKLSVGETVTVLTPIAQALGYLHGRGFTHSDVSPGNVLFTGHGKPMLADLGVARIVGDAAALAWEGTDGFMDPAPVDAMRAGLQPERDVYSVAALGWFCLTGEPPRRTADRAPLPLLRPDVPAELAAALESGLSDDRRLRPAAFELAAAVYRSAAPLPVDLGGSVHATVIPELLTRRRMPDRPGSAAGKTLRSWHRRLSTSRWSGLVGARQVLPFPMGNEPAAAPAIGDKRAVTPPRNDRTAQAVRGKHSTRGTPSRQEPHVRPGLHGHSTMPWKGRVWGILQPAGAAVAVLAGAIWAAGAFGPTGAGPSLTAGHSAPSASPQPAADGSESTGRIGTSVDLDIPEDVAGQLQSANPAEAVHALAWIRSRAFSSGRLELLDQVNAPGSAAFAADERVRGRLRDSGHVLAGFTSTISSSDVEPGNSSSRAVVTVTSATSSYQEKDGTGAIVAAAPAGEAQELRLVLVSVNGRWHLAEILPGP
ncbi:serine/threonine protein kinase [Arthrobacter sp. CDRTa11]|uniref:serine/threonine-protein kinase n=1 Tax=Arthrobacter sp. CDRTa11 TaxID=2651199 RepID=UPI002265CA7C|nr:serine/threonine-protein kinase [Arthrobacter sp. CDRTa11]UZX02710.1 serine/threonine protein kinase [Arthrobacter sp. CDRTa11]